MAKDAKALQDVKDKAFLLAEQKRELARKAGKLQADIAVAEQEKEALEEEREAAKAAKAKADEQLSEAKAAAKKAEVQIVLFAFSNQPRSYFSL